MTDSTRDAVIMAAVQNPKEDGWQHLLTKYVDADNQIALMKQKQEETKFSVETIGPFLLKFAESDTCAKLLQQGIMNPLITAARYGVKQDTVKKIVDTIKTTYCQEQTKDVIADCKEVKDEGIRVNCTHAELQKKSHQHIKGSSCAGRIHAWR